MGQYGIIVVFSLLTIISCGTVFKKFYPLAEDIISHMTLQQKLGQMVLSDFDQFNKRGDSTQYEQISSYGLGAVQVGGNGCPDGQGNIKLISDCSNATRQQWKDVADKSKAQLIKVNSPDGEISIQILLATDAVHGNQHVLGTILFPHNIGMAASHDPQNFANAAKWNANGIKASGFNYAFSPTVAVSHSPQWGRFYETMGDNLTEVRAFAKAYVSSLQNIQDGYLTGVLASTKHFLGDGATFNGLDEGNNKVYNMKKFIETNLVGYLGALESNTGNMMVSYSAINDIAMSVNAVLMQGLLKDQHQFDGFLISDYDAVGKVSSQGLPTSGVKMSFKQSYLMSLNAGMDMYIQSPRDDNEVNRFFSNANELIKAGSLRESRINDAVKRILAVKLAMQLIKVPDVLAQKYGYKNAEAQAIDMTSQLSSEDEYQDALKAAQESLVLLKNSDNLLPLNKNNLKYIVLVGEVMLYFDGVLTNFQSFDNIGMQNGGWSVRWQGYEGNQYWSGDLKQQSRSSSILDGILDQIKGSNVQILRIQYDSPTDLDAIGRKRQDFLAQLSKINDMTSTNTVMIGAFGESPYAEFMGEVNSEYCKGTTQQVEGCAYNSHSNEYMPQQQRVDLSLSYDQSVLDVINTIREKGSIPLVSVLFSGRPMLVQDTLSISNSFIAAWLPGTSGGQAVANSIFGTYQFRSRELVNTLPVPWISTQESLKDFPIYAGEERPEIKAPLFQTGYGLSTKSQQ